MGVPQEYWWVYTFDVQFEGPHYGKPKGQINFAQRLKYNSFVGTRKSSLIRKP